MARIIVNKHFPNSNEITDVAFSPEFGKGEIIISNEVGSEALYIQNEAGNVVKVTGNYSDISGTTTPDEIKDFIKNYIDEELKKVTEYVLQEVSESQYKELIEKGEVVIIDNKTGEEKNIVFDENTYYMVFEDVNQ